MKKSFLTISVMLALAITVVGCATRSDLAKVQSDQMQIDVKANQASQEARKARAAADAAAIKANEAAARAEKATERARAAEERAKIEREIKKDKQEILYSIGIIDLPTVILIAKVPRADATGRQHVELSIENRGKMSLQIRMDTVKKFVARDGKSYDILWERNKDGGAIMAVSSGEGCQLTGKNTLFLINPGSKCTLSAPMSLPGVSQQPPDGMIKLDLFTFDMRRVSAYEDRTSPLVRSPRKAGVSHLQRRKTDEPDI